MSVKGNDRVVARDADWWAEQLYAAPPGPVWPLTAGERLPEFLAKVAGVPEGARVLDLGCGGGEHLIHLAQGGHSGVGVDLSPRVIARAQDAAAMAGVGRHLKFVHGDMAFLDFCFLSHGNTQPFDVALLLGGSWGLQEEIPAHRTLLNAGYWLKPGGKLLLASLGPAAATQPARNYEIEKDGGRIQIESWFDAAASGRRQAFAFVDSYGVTHTDAEAHLTRVYSVAELTLILERAGLALTATYADWSLAPAPYDESRDVAYLALATPLTP